MGPRTSGALAPPAIRMRVRGRLITATRRIPAALREQVRQQPDAPAYTFVDYEVDPAGYSQSLTWSQLHRRAQVVAAELASCGSPGDRVAILAPQGFEYIVGVLGAMEAGFIAVPLSVPLFGALDERVAAALRDSSPAALLKAWAAACTKNSGTTRTASRSR